MVKIKIPIFPEFKKLEISDRQTLQAYFNRTQPEISDQSFANLFLWRNFYDIRITSLNQNICLYCASPTTPEKEFFFQPFGEGRIPETVAACLDFLKKQDRRPIVRRASEKFVKNYFNHQRHFLVERDIDSSDYIYLAEDLIKLQGRKHDGRRNHIKRFKKTYPDFCTEFINSTNISECVELKNEWLQEKQQRLSENHKLSPEERAYEKTFMKAEASAVEGALLNLERLGLTGLAVRISGKIRAFSIGEKLNEETALIHIEKADHKYRGLSQFINQAFCEQAWADSKFINRMEDLGIEGLRKAKLALGPHHLAEKYNIAFNITA